MFFIQGQLSEERTRVPIRGARVFFIIISPVNIKTLTKQNVIPHQTKFNRRDYGRKYQCICNGTTAI
jgi:hypothetical protein